MEYNISKEMSPEGLDLPETVVACIDDYVPSIEEYFTAFNITGVVLFTLGGMAVIITVLVFTDTLRAVVKSNQPSVKAHSAFVLSVYPVVTIATYCAVVVPRAQLLAEAVTQGMFMFALYQLFCLLVAYCGGEKELIERVKPQALQMKVGPCCCYPCCALPQLSVTKNHVLFLRLLVLQLPVVQGLSYMVQLVIWAEEQSLYQVNYWYFQPIIITSILFGIWGMLMTLRMLAEILKDHFTTGKFLVLQMVLLCAKLQGIIARVVVMSGGVVCRPPITAAVYTNLIYNSVMMAEMVVLSLIARQLYKRELPALPAPFPTTITVLTDKAMELNNTTNNNQIIPTADAKNNQSARF